MGTTLILDPVTALGLTPEPNTMWQSRADSRLAASSEASVTSDRSANPIPNIDSRFRPEDGGHLEKTVRDFTGRKGGFDDEYSSRRVCFLRRDRRSSL